MISISKTFQLKVSLEIGLDHNFSSTLSLH